jgi:hypothetical protein
MPEFAAQRPFEVGRRIELRGPSSYAWLVVTLADSEPEALDNLILEIAAATSLPFRVLNIQDLSFEDVQAHLHQPDADGVVLSGFQDFDPPIWSKWDVNRSRFQRPGPIVLLLTTAELSRFCSLAPNLRSFVGGSIFPLASSGGQLSEAEKSQRIQDLEKHYGTSSQDVIQRAQDGILPPEPQFVEWLVLLGRGDLV